MPFLPPNQQRQSTEGITLTNAISMIINNDFQITSWRAAALLTG